MVEGSRHYINIRVVQRARLYLPRKGAMNCSP
jgi:hypothetical protein